MDIKKLVGQRIKELRCRNNLTQEKLAELVGITTKYQSRIETGCHFPSAELIEQYAEALCLFPTDILRINSKEDRKIMLKKIKTKLSKLSDEELEKIYRQICL